MRKLGLIIILLCAVAFAFADSDSGESASIAVDVTHTAPVPPNEDNLGSGNTLVDCLPSPSLVRFTSAESLIIVVDTRTDTDGDGLCDEDEILIYGTNPTLVDTDGDGMTDFEEVVAASNPNLKSSRFVIQSLSSLPPAEGGGFKVSFLTATGRTYKVFYCDDLLSGSWTILAEDISGTGAEVSVTDPSTSINARCYRIQVEMD